MNLLANAAGILNTMIILLALVGGYLALKNGKHQKTGEIQGQVIEALKAELETLQRRVDLLEKENTHLNHLLSLIKLAFRKRGLAISIDGDLVTINDEKGCCSQYGRTLEEYP